MSMTEKYKQTRIVRCNSAEGLAQNATIGEILRGVPEQHLDAVTHYLRTYLPVESGVALGQAVTESPIQCAAELAEAATQALKGLRRTLFHPIKRFGSQSKQLKSSSTMQPSMPLTSTIQPLRHTTCR
jgi:hypothetical protein